MDISLSTGINWNFIEFSIGSRACCLSFRTVFFSIFSVLFRRVFRGMLGLRRVGAFVNSEVGRVVTK